MKKNIIIVILVLFVVFITGYIFFTKVYMSDKNKLSRYLVSKDYICIEETCTLKKKNVKYMMDLNKRELYISNEIYNLSIGSEYPILRMKNGNKKCSYYIDDYKRGDLITNKFSYDKDCKQYIDDINDYIEEYMVIITESNVK